MNLTNKLKMKILIEFKRGMSTARCDDLYLQPVGTTEKVLREALCRQDEADRRAANLLELELALDKRKEGNDEH